MGLQKNVTSRDGVVHSEAYIHIKHVDIDWKRGKASFSLDTYHDKAACDAGKGKISAAGGGIPRRLRVIKEDFATYFGVSVLDTADKNPIERSYEYAKTVIAGTSDVDPD
jgi:hypothetical protein